MELKTGARLRSQVCATEVVVVRAPDAPVELGCGGAPLVEAGAAIDGAGVAAGLDGGTLLGKRYTTSEPSDLELLVIKAGAGTLTADGAALVLKEAKPLPASD
jgi:hypothetical protein